MIADLHLFLVRWSIKARRLGWYATRQAMPERGASMQDIAWVLVSQLMIQGA